MLWEKSPENGFFVTIFLSKANLHTELGENHAHHH